MAVAATCAGTPFLFFTTPVEQARAAY